MSDLFDVLLDLIGDFVIDRLPFKRIPRWIRFIILILLLIVIAVVIAAIVLGQ